MEKGKQIGLRRLVWLIGVLVLVFCGLAIAENYGALSRVSYDRMAQTNKAPTITKITLDPREGWTNSNVYLKKGDLVSIAADGLIDPGVRLSRGPDGAGQDYLKEMTHGCKYMELLGRLSDSQPVCVGSNATFEVMEGGQLSFHVNEQDSIRYDDLGYFNIEVRVISGATAPANAPGTVPATGPYLTAVVDLASINLPADEVKVLSLSLRGQLAATGKFVLIDQAQVNDVIARLRIPANEAAGVQAAIRIGNALGAQQVVIGQVGRIGNAYTVTLQRVNPRTGQVENTVVDTYNVYKEQLPAQIGNSVKKL